MVDPKDRYLFQPLLLDYGLTQRVALDELAPEYTSLFGHAERERHLVPGARNVEIEHVCGRVVCVDWKRRLAMLKYGGEDLVLEFDAVAISPGVLAQPRTTVEVARGAKDVFTFATLEDADSLRERLREKPPESVSVVGAGYIGVEVATALAELDSSCEVALFGTELLRGCEPANRRRSEARLEELGVMKGPGRVEAAGNGGVLWRHSPSEPLDRHECDLTILTGAMSARSAGCTLEPPPVPWRPDSAGPSAGTGVGGRIPVDDLLRVAPGVYCIGDAASAGAPPNAQAALEQAEVAAWNMFAQLTGRSRRKFRRYSPNPLGEFVALGVEDAAAVVAPVRLAGLLPLALPPSAAAAAAAVLAPVLSANILGAAKVELGGNVAAALRRLSYLIRLPTLGHRAFVAERWANRPFF